MFNLFIDLRERHQFVVPFIYAFISCFSYVPWSGIDPTTLGCQDDTLNALTNGATQPGPKTYVIRIWRGCSFSCYTIFWYIQFSLTVTMENLKIIMATVYRDLPSMFQSCSRCFTYIIWIFTKTFKDRYYWYYYLYFKDVKTKIQSS